MRYGFPPEELQLSSMILEVVEMVPELMVAEEI